jgi:hypothetical protein
MYFWRIGGLKRELAAGSISEAGALPYLLWTGALTAFAGSVPLGDSNQWDVVAGAASAALFVGGTVYAFRRNGGSSGATFLVRYLSISWVVALRVLVLFALPSIVAMLAIEAMLWGEVPEETTALEAAASIAVELVLYARIAHHVGEVAAGRPAA